MCIYVKYEIREVCVNNKGSLVVEKLKFSQEKQTHNSCIGRIKFCGCQICCIAHHVPPIYSKSLLCVCHVKAAPFCHFKRRTLVLFSCLYIQLPVRKMTENYRYGRNYPIFYTEQDLKRQLLFLSKLVPTRRNGTVLTPFFFFFDTWF